MSEHEHESHEGQPAQGEPSQSSAFPPQGPGEPGAGEPQPSAPGAVPPQTENESAANATTHVEYESNATTTQSEQASSQQQGTGAGGVDEAVTKSPTEVPGGPGEPGYTSTPPDEHAPTEEPGTGEPAPQGDQVEPDGS